MVTVYYGPAGSGKSTAMMRALCEMAAAGHDRLVYLVPEVVTHETELRLCRAGGAPICRSAEVLSLSRMVSRVGALCGGTARTVLDEAGRMLAMSRAVDSVRDRLVHYGATVTEPEYLSSFLTLSAELKSYCVDPEALLALSGQTEGSLSVRLKDLSLIYSAYDAICAGTGLDRGDLPDLLADALDETGWAVGRCFFVDCFSFFTLQEQRVLERLVRDSDELILALTAEEDEGGIFEAAAETERLLRRMAGRYGKKFSRRAFPNDRDPVPEVSSDLALVRRALLSGSRSGPEEAGEGSVVPVSAANMAATCEYTAARITELVRNGVRYRDIAVTWPTGSGFEMPLQAVLEDWGIPVNITEKRRISETSVAGGVCAALSAVNGGLRREDVIRWLRAGFSGLTVDEIDRLENYAILWDIRGSRWTVAFSSHPEGLGAVGDPTQALDALNDSRRRAVEPLLQLRDALRQGKDAAEQVLALYGFLERLDLAGQLQALAERLIDRGERQTAQEYSQIYGIVVSAMEQTAAVCAGMKTSPDRFARLFRSVLDLYDVGTIPAVMDAVSADSVDAMRYRKPDWLFVLGADEDLLPASVSRDSLLSDADRRALLGLGVGLSPDSERRVNQSLLDVYLLLSSPRRGLWMITDADSRPSFVFSRLCLLFGQAREAGTSFPQQLRRAAALAIREPDSPLGEALLAEAKELPPLREETEALSRAGSWTLGDLRTETAAALYGSTLRLSVSRLEKWNTCRFRYFCEYGLGLKERARAAFDAPAFGSLTHRVLEGVVSAARDAGGFGRYSDEAILSLAGALQDRYAVEELGGAPDRDSRSRYLYARSGQEIRGVLLDLAEELRRSDFVPEHLELAFGRGALPAIPVEGVRAVLSGVVDRIDGYTAPDGRHLIRVIDYKTGSTAFDYTRLVNGLALQLPVYLFALERLGFGQGVGMLYLPAREQTVHLTTLGRPTPEAVEKVRRTKGKRTGLLTEDPEILRAMEHPDEKGTRRYLKVSEKGGVPSGDLLSDLQWRQLRALVDSRVSEAAKGIASGDARPDPYVFGTADACTYCPYGAVCRGAEKKRYLPRLSKEDLFAELARQEVGAADGREGIAHG